MPARIDIRIEPEGHGRFPLEFVANLPDTIELAFALDVDLPDAVFQGEDDLVT